MKQESLLEPYHRFVKETQWLLIAFHTSLSSLKNLGTHEATHLLSGEMAVVRLHDAWARFCREITVSSAADRPYSANGIPIPLAPNIRNRSDVIPLLLSTYRPARFYEPSWAISYDCIRAAQLLNLANFQTISAALGANNSPAEEIRLVRNFFAHRHIDTATKIRSHPTFSTIANCTLEDLVGAIVAPSTTRMELWIIGLRNIAKGAIQ